MSVSKSIEELIAGTKWKLQNRFQDVVKENPEQFSDREILKILLENECEEVKAQEELIKRFFRIVNLESFK